MNIKHILTTTLAAAATLLTSSCGNDSGQTDTGPGQPERLPISISTAVAQISDSRVADTYFEVGDKIGLYVVNRKADGSQQELAPSGNYVDNMLCQLGTSWITASPIFWQDHTTHADFYIYHPHKPEISNVEAVTFSLDTDQSTKQAYNEADVLTGVATDVTPSDKPVYIVAKHIMSQLVITLVPGDGLTADKLAASDVKVRINNVRPNATVSITAATATAAGEPTTIIPLRIGDLTYKAIIAPQEVAADNIITVTADGRDFNLARTINFESGKRYRSTITLNKVGDGINVGIDDWDEDGEDYGDVAE